MIMTMKEVTAVAEMSVMLKARQTRGSDPTAMAARLACARMAAWSRRQFSSSRRRSVRRLPGEGKGCGGGALGCRNSSNKPETTMPQSVPMPTSAIRVLAKSIVSAGDAKAAVMTIAAVTPNSTQA